MRLVWPTLQGLLPLQKKRIPIWTTGRYSQRLFFRQNFPKISKFWSKPQNLIQIFDFDTQINFSKNSNLIIFGPSLSPNFVQWGTLTPLQGCREKIRDYTHIFLRSIRVSFEGLLVKKENGIPIWTTGRYSQNIFFWEFCDFPKSYLKHLNKGPWGPDTSFLYSNELFVKMKNFDFLPLQGAISQLFEICQIVTKFSLLH